MLKSKFLLPAKFKKYGWMLFVPSLILGFTHWLFDYSPVLTINVFAISFDGPDNRELFGFIEDNIFNEILGLSIITSGLIVAFSKEFDEDELISRMRLDCLVWAIFWNYALLALAIILFYGLSFLTVLIFNMFTPLVLFIIRFNWLVVRSRKSLKNEE